LCAQLLSVEITLTGSIKITTGDATKIGRVNLTITHPNIRGALVALIIIILFFAAGVIVGHLLW
jgi:hypothetical protein